MKMENGEIDHLDVEDRCTNLLAIANALMIVGDEHIIDAYTPKVLLPVLYYLSQQIEAETLHIQKYILGTPVADPQSHKEAASC